MLGHFRIRVQNPYSVKIRSTPWYYRINELERGIIYRPLLHKQIVWRHLILGFELGLMNLT